MSTMIELLFVPLLVFALIVLIFIILAFIMLRGMRRAREIRLNQSPLTVPIDRRKPADDYHEQIWLPLCGKIANAASSRMKRPLTAKERRAIWRSRTALVLEILLNEVEKAASAEEVSSLLANVPLGMDRPDSSGWCNATADHVV